MIYSVGKLYWKFSIEFQFGFLLTIHDGNLLFCSDTYYTYLMVQDWKLRVFNTCNAMASPS